MDRQSSARWFGAGTACRQIWGLRKALTIIYAIRSHSPGCIVLHSYCRVLHYTKHATRRACRRIPLRCATAVLTLQLRADSPQAFRDMLHSRFSNSKSSMTCPSPPALREILEQSWPTLIAAVAATFLDQFVTSGSAPASYWTCRCTACRRSFTLIFATLC